MSSKSQYSERGRTHVVQQTLVLDVVQMLHVLRSAFANSVALSREISGAERSERSRALIKTARATLMSCVCAMLSHKGWCYGNVSLQGVMSSKDSLN